MWRWLRKLLKLQPAAGGDVGAVVAAAAILHISEFELFRLAYHDWYGTAPPPDVLAEPFEHYLLKTLVPPWVRQFARKILKLSAEKRLNPVEYGIQPPPAARIRSVLLGIAALLFMFALVAMLVSMAMPDCTPGSTGCGSVCFFPPCY